MTFLTDVLSQNSIHVFLFLLVVHLMHSGSSCISLNCMIISVY